MFQNIITPEFKNLFKEAIDSLLAQNALTVPCLLKFETTKRDLCYNCLYDPMTERSLNMPKPGAPVPFAENTICPVCNGYGYIDTAKDEIINLAIIFDSKYWLNWNSNSVNVPDGVVQSISSISLLPKIRNCKEMIMNTDISNYGSYRYSRMNDPEPAGFGSHDYIITMWQRS